MDFKEFQLDSRIEAAIRTAGFTAPTPVQVQTIGRVMQGQDLIGLAQTGTGKTAAYVLPLLHRLLQSKNRKNRALILAPTRELAEQIHQDIQTLGRRTGMKSLTLYGGAAIGPQIQALKKGVDIVVACPGRLIDHINRGNMDFSGLETLVLDEADQMLDMGFIPDIRRILKKIPRNRQSLMFSATMRKEIRVLADEVLHKPALVQVGEPAAAETVSHTHFPVSQNQKTSLLLKILKDTRIASVLIFTRTKHRAKRLSEALERAGYGAASLQGNLSQNRRQAALNGFKSGKYQILVATDIASRGIDVSGVSHVVNYDVPATAEAYIHRIGRTGRAEHTGSAFNLVTNEDRQVLKSIDRVVGSLIERRTFADFDYAVSAPGAKTPSKPQKHTRRPGSGFYKSR